LSLLTLADQPFTIHKRLVKWDIDSQGAALAMGSINIAFKAQLVVPEQRQIYDYWLSCAAGKAMPCRGDIDPAQIPRLLPYISLVDIDADLKCCKVRLAGTRLRDVYDREITGLRIEELDLGAKRDYWMAAYRHTAIDGKPTQGIVRGPRVNKEHLVQYWIKLPLAHADSDAIAMILCLDYFLSAVDEEDRQANSA
jgi:PAS domain